MKSVSFGFLTFFGAFLVGVVDLLLSGVGVAEFGSVVGAAWSDVVIVAAGDASVTDPVD